MGNGATFGPACHGVGRSCRRGGRCVAPSVFGNACSGRAPCRCLVPRPAASGTLDVLSDSAACLAVTSAHPVAYRIAPCDPHAHLFEVRCTVADPDAGGQAFRLPVWIPGSYLIREFARHFVAVRAETQGRSLAIAKEAKDTWRAAPSATPVTVIAQIYAFDLSVRTAYLDASRGYFNGPAVFLCPDGRADRRCEVEIIAPDGDVGRAWRVATTLPGDERSTAGFGRYHAANYDELIDHPVEMSDFASASFEAGGARHDIAVSGRHRGDLDRLARDLARVCQWQCDLFGGAPDSRAPFDRYLFQVTAVGDGYGGLEHRSSTSLLCKRGELPQPGVAKVTDDYRRFLGLASHEYFHSWNVKRIKPAAFVPYDLGGENYTRQLWAFEGITSYYDDLALVRSGVIDHASYLELLGRAITTVLRNPGRHVQSVADSSFDAWIKHYRRDENSPNAVVSYYAKGSLVALSLDLILRANGSSLDFAMRALWQQFGRTGTGVPEDGIARLASDARRPRSRRILCPPCRRRRGSAACRSARERRRDTEAARGRQRTRSGRQPGHAGRKRGRRRPGDTDHVRFRPRRRQRAQVAARLQRRPRRAGRSGRGRHAGGRRWRARDTGLHRCAPRASARRRGAHDSRVPA